MTIVEEVEQQQPSKTTAQEVGNDQCDSDKDDGGHPNMSKGERKARKMLSKMGLKPATGFFKMELKRHKQGPLCIREPLVYEIPGPVPTYIIVGPIQVDKFTDDMARQAKMMKDAVGRPATGESAAKQTAPPKYPIEESEAEDVGELNEVDIQLAIEQTGKSRNAVIRQLRKTDGDLIEAIMQLTS